MVWLEQDCLSWRIPVIKKKVRMSFGVGEFLFNELIAWVRYVYCVVVFQWGLMGHRLLIGVYFVVLGFMSYFMRFCPFLLKKKWFCFIFEVSKFGCVCVFFLFQFGCYGESLLFFCPSEYLGEIGIELWYEINFKV